MLRLLLLFLLPPVGGFAQNKFTLVTKDAKETTLSILFTDGKGKYFNATPQIELLDSATSKVVKKFYRTVDVASSPDPQIVTPGTYDLRIVGRSNMLVRHVTVEANKKNKLTIRVGDGSLRFRYVDPNDNPLDRPVSEYEAIVTIRFEAGPSVHQQCTQELEYEPGNYYIEVNTLPLGRYNVDIDFGATTEIRFCPSGTLEVSNTTPVKLTVYQRLFKMKDTVGRYVKFYEMQVKPGQPNHLKLQPRGYKVSWTDEKTGTENTRTFNIYSDKVIHLNLLQ